MAEELKMDRNLALEAVRVTEAAALSASRLMGRGDEKAADQAAVDAMRQSLNSLSIEGTVVIRMYADEHGKLLTDSIRIAESSGYPTLDSAALAAAPRLRFAPARHEGKPVATPFLQPFQFRNPARTEITP